MVEKEMAPRGEDVKLVTFLEWAVGILVSVAIALTTILVTSGSFARGKDLEKVQVGKLDKEEFKEFKAAQNVALRSLEVKVDLLSKEQSESQRATLALLAEIKVEIGKLQTKMEGFERPK